MANLKYCSTVKLNDPNDNIDLKNDIGNMIDKLNTFINTQYSLDIVPNNDEIDKDTLFANKVNSQGKLKYSSELHSEILSKYNEINDAISQLPQRNPISQTGIKWVTKESMNMNMKSLKNFINNTDLLNIVENNLQGNQTDEINQCDVVSIKCYCDQHNDIQPFNCVEKMKTPGKKLTCRCNTNLGTDNDSSWDQESNCTSFKRSIECQCENVSTDCMSYGTWFCYDWNHENAQLQRYVSEGTCTEQWSQDMCWCDSFYPKYQCHCECNTVHLNKSYSKLCQCNSNCKTDKYDYCSCNSYVSRTVGCTENVYNHDISLDCLTYSVNQAQDYTCNCDSHKSCQVQGLCYCDSHCGCQNVNTCDCYGVGPDVGCSNVQDCSCDTNRTHTFSSNINCFCESHCDCQGVCRSYDSSCTTDNDSWMCSCNGNVNPPAIISNWDLQIKTCPCENHCNCNQNCQTENYCNCQSVCSCESHGTNGHARNFEICSTHAY